MVPVTLENIHFGFAWKRKRERESPLPAQLCMLKYNIVSVLEVSVCVCVWLAKVNSKVCIAWVTGTTVSCLIIQNMKHYIIENLDTSKLIKHLYVNTDMNAHFCFVLFRSSGRIQSICCV